MTVRLNGKDCKLQDIENYLKEVFDKIDPETNEISCDIDITISGTEEDPIEIHLWDYPRIIALNEIIQGEPVTSERLKNLINRSREGAIAKENIILPDKFQRFDL